MSLLKRFQRGGDNDDGTQISSNIPFRCFITCLAFADRASPVNAEVTAFND